MKRLKTIALIPAILLGALTFATSANAEEVEEGKTYYAVKNLHQDSPKNRSFAMNYQLSRLVPICAKVEVKDVAKKEIEYSYDGTTFSHIWDKHSRKAGVSIQDSFLQFFSATDKCDEIKADIAKLSKIDQEGIKKGLPMVGMSKDGILLAMGRPPLHATPDLSASSWMYWLNKWKKQAIDFDDKGIVTAVRL